MWQMSELEDSNLELMQVFRQIRNFGSLQMYTKKLAELLMMIRKFDKMDRLLNMVLLLKKL